MFSSFRTLRNPNYRLYFFGQTLSMSGNQMQTVAVSWLVYRLSASASWIGFIMFSTLFTAFVCAPFAGALADRMSRQRVLILVQWAGMLQALALALLALTDTVQLWHVAVIAIINGAINAFDMTTRHAFVVDMVGKDDLGNAIALNSVIINGSRIVGPALAGLLIGVTGEKACFAINAFSYFAAIYSLTHMKITPAERSVERQDYFSAIGEGLAYVRKHREIAWLLGVLSLVSFVTPSVNVVLPVFSKVILHGGPRTFAWLSSCVGIGAIFGALSLGRQERKNLQRDVIQDLILIGGAFILFAASRNIWLSAFAAGAIGFLNLRAYPRVNTAIQREVDDRVRGRVMSIYSMSYLGAAPPGTLLAGWTADATSAPSMVFGAAGLLILPALWMIRRLPR